MSLSNVLAVISDRSRWRILDELLKGEALPVMKLARRLDTPRSNVSKHVNVLEDYGVLTCAYEKLYRIVDGFLVPGQRMLDFGAVVLRPDRLDADDHPKPAG